MSDWLYIIDDTLRRAAREADAAAACCDCNPEDDLGDVKDEIGQAVEHIEIAQRMVAAAINGEE